MYLKVWCYTNRCFVGWNWFCSFTVGTSFCVWSDRKGVSGCVKFYQYICGRSIEVNTNHKPLVCIMRKDFAKVGSILRRKNSPEGIEKCNKRYAVCHEWRYIVPPGNKFNERIWRENIKNRNENNYNKDSNNGNVDTERWSIRYARTDTSRHIIGDVSTGRTVVWTQTGRISWPPIKFKNYKT